MKGRVCTCKYELTEFPEDSGLPCMDIMAGLMGNPELNCSNCIYCQIKNDTKDGK